MKESEKKRLRGAGHSLNAVVLIGTAGLTGAVGAEIDLALDAHELIKIKVRVGDRNERDALIKQICANTGAELIQRVGNTALLYRKQSDQT
ncbi:MAG: YhbY family RNA-binding protein [Gammaproteobacteria bacterium]|nr:YhbY family RNA-binding protein [Gammaproteobacteria bacterium]MDH3768927.1 YhbY family RNA-binding protein [Gammaproteobacteria bacterium]